jgi:predicted DNA-binding transcriptional regulator YafY
VLREEYHAPIEYSKSECAYSLLDHEWTFQVPALLNPDELLAITIGGKLSQDIFPAALSKRVSKAVDEVLQYNESETLSTELLSSLKVLSASTVSGEIFEIVFDAWQQRKVLRINYADKNGDTILRDIEPHTLVFYDMKWSIKGFCRLRNQARTFHLGRIKSAVLQETTFEPSQEIIDSVTTDSFLDYEKIKNVELLLTESGKQFALTNPLHSNQSFLQEENGCRLFVPAISLEQLTPWILKQQGNAKPLSPPKVVEAIRQSVRKLADACQAYDTEEIRQKIKKSK